MFIDSKMSILQGILEILSVTASTPYQCTHEALNTRICSVKDNWDGLFSLVHLERFDIVIPRPDNGIHGES